MRMFTAQTAQFECVGMHGNMMPCVPNLVCHQLIPCLQPQLFVLADGEPSEADRQRITAILWYAHGEVGSEMMSRYPNLKVISNFGALQRLSMRTSNTIALQCPLALCSNIVTDRREHC